MGGEKAGVVSSGATTTGSPPRRRGKVSMSRHCRPPPRITPAWAGKRWEQRYQTFSPEDHPRVGGEKRMPCFSGRCCGGSPPRGRGKGMTSWGGVLKDRITPAWAGKSSRLALPHGLPPDHPRVGGEKRAVLSALSFSRGSPPRGRGKVVRPDVVAKAAGITPAWAGKSREIPLHLRAAKDHPRVGGEKQTGTVYAVLPYGSPPRRQGKEQGAGGRMAAHGITPAWAGKSTQVGGTEVILKDHPRVGGEKGSSIHGLLFMLGSPPRGRGKDIR